MHTFLQVSVQVLSSNGSCDPDVLAINAASASLAVSDIPWAGPVGAVRVAVIDGRMVLGPTPAQMQAADLSLLVACSGDSLVMLEAEVMTICLSVNGGLYCVIMTKKSLRFIHSIHMCIRRVKRR